MPRILIVDDSPTARLALRKIFHDPANDLEVIDEARNRQEALSKAKRLRPDVITMDVHLGEDDGVEVTAAIMAAAPTRILIVTGIDPDDPGLSFRAMRAGALDVFAKPPAPGTPTYESETRRLLRVLVALSQVPVVTRRHRKPATPSPEQRKRALADTKPRKRARPADREGAAVVAIGLSTGGPPLLQALLQEIPKPFAQPILIVQHIAAGFAESLVQWLGETTGHDIRVCKSIQQLQPGVVYVAPDDRHMRLQSPTQISPVNGKPRNFQLPSVDEMFESLAEFAGTSTTAVIMSGMGSDGSLGMEALYEHGVNTIAQKFDTCVVDSMPRLAAERGVIDKIMSPTEIAGHLTSLHNRRL